MSTPKFYVVWVGRKTGVFNNWEECKKQVVGFEGAKYKSFKDENDAVTAFKNDYKKQLYLKSKNKAPQKTLHGVNTNYIQQSLSVDAACSGNPGVMEYQGVHVLTGDVWFHKKFEYGTNNIGEFLAIVHGLAELKKRNINIPVYTDSATALAWVRKKKCATKLTPDDKTKSLFDLIRRAENWLINNSWEQKLLKWDTEKWGEIPADFGRK